MHLVHCVILNSQLWKKQNKTKLHLITLARRESARVISQERKKKKEKYLTQYSHNLISQSRESSKLRASESSSRANWVFRIPPVLFISFIHSFIHNVRARVRLSSWLSAWFFLFANVRRRETFYGYTKHARARAQQNKQISKRKWNPWRNANSTSKTFTLFFVFFFFTFSLPVLL